MEFREAVTTDARAIQRVARASWHAAYGEIIGEEAVEEKIEEWYGKDVLKESIGRKDAPMFVAEDDEMVGFAQGAPSEDGPADATVTRIYVHPDRWGEGVGTALLNELFDALRSDGHESVWLAVIAGNSVGWSFYEKHDFEVHERKTEALAEQEIEEIVLTRKL